MALTPNGPSHYVPLAALAVKIQTLFAERSTLVQAVARDLRRSLLDSYPNLDITDQLPVLLTPRYHYENKVITALPAAHTPLVEVLIQRFVDDKHVDFGNGEVITDEPARHPPRAGALKPFDAETAINARGAQLLRTCQSALIEDWTSLSYQAKSRFEALAGLLKDGFRDVAAQTATLDVDQQQMVSDVVQVADNNLRQSGVRAYLVDQWGEEGSPHLELLRGMVLIAPKASGEHVLLFTLGAGVEVFDSRAALGAALPRWLTGLRPGKAMQWRLYEPGANIFDSFALTFLAKQLADLGQLANYGRQFPFWGSAALKGAHSWITGDFDSLQLADNHDLQRLYSALPSWLKQVDRDLRSLFSQQMRQMAELTGRAGWKFFNEGVPTILDFTRERLVAQYPQASDVKPDDVQLTIHTVRGASAAGGFPVKVITTLLEVALENLAALPGDAISVQLRDGSPPPAWMNAQAIKKLVTDADIGRTYPELVSAKLRDDQAEVAWRSQHFAEQLRIELPMVALQALCRGHGGVTRKGYDCVAAVVRETPEQRYVGDQAIVLRPLGFRTGADVSPDNVLNMFVIGPKDFEQGPHLLYRPMSEEKLLEFSSHEALFEAIKQPGTLQQQVLAWMSREARTVYQGEGFNVPHFKSIDGLAMLFDAMFSKPALLSRDEVSGDYLAHLYHSQVRATLELADRQSVSNSENLWARRLEGLALGLNSVLSFVTGPAAVVGWMLVAWDVQGQINAAHNNPTQDKSAVMAGFFLNMALVLMHYSRTEISSARLERVKVDEALTVPAAEEAAVALKPLPEARAQNASLTATVPIDYGFVFTSTRLTPAQEADLKSFAVPAPQGAQRLSAGTLAGLYQNATGLYANLADGWFPVTRQPDGVRVQATDARPGPWLKPQGNGQWVLDLRLRLAGGSLGLQGQVSQAQITLKERFTSLYRAFEAREHLEAGLVARVLAENGFDNRLKRIEIEQAKALVQGEQSRELLDLLEQRRRFEVVRHYAKTRSALMAGRVDCLRIQVRLLEQKRHLICERLAGAPSHSYFLNLGEVAKRNPSLEFRTTLGQIVALHDEAITLCREEQQTFALMLKEAVAGDVNVARLDTPEFKGKAAIARWQEASLRPRVLLCLKTQVAPHQREGLALLTQANLYCRMKLATYRELFDAPALGLETRARVLNDVIDALAWEHVRLHRLEGELNGFVDQPALSEYRAFLLGVRQDIVGETLEHYARAATAPASAMQSDEVGEHRLLIRHERLGLLIAVKGERIASSSSSSSSTASEPENGNEPGTGREGVAELEGHDGSLTFSLDGFVQFIDPYTGAAYAGLRKTISEQNIHWDLVAPTVERPSQALMRYMNALRVLRRGEARLADLANLESNPLVSVQLLQAEAEIMADELRIFYQLFEDRDVLDVSLMNQMDGVARQLSDKSREVAQRMILARDPTPAGVRQLLNEGVVEIKEVLATGREPGAGTPPLFRSFYISKVPAVGAPPTAVEILWFAHFHYAPQRTDSRGLGFTRAHLKRYVRHSETFDQQIRNARNDEQVLNVLRTTLDHEAAQGLFFPQETLP